MAKQVRQVTSPDSWWSDWYSYQYANQDQIEALDNSLTRAQKIAEELGISIDEARQQINDEYALIRDEHFATWNSAKAVKDQQFAIRNNTLDSYCSVFQRADRILTNSPVNVLLNDDPSMATPAYNDGKNITFNGAFVKGIDEESVQSLHGLNYHELAHLLFTPRMGSGLGKWVTETRDVVKSYQTANVNGETVTHEYTEGKELVEPRRLQAFNMLEDCRAEYYLTLKYPSVREFLVATMGGYLAEHLDQMSDNYALLAGRKYLNREIRLLSATLYIKKHGADKAQKIHAITNEYRKLVFPRQYDRAIELIEQFIEVLKSTEADKTPPQGGCGMRPIMRNGKPTSEKEQDSLVKSDGEPDEQFGEDMSHGKDKGTNTGEIDPEHSDFYELEQELANKIKQETERAKNDQSVKTKVADTVKAISRDNSVKPIIGKARQSALTPTMTEVTTSRLFGQELERLRIDSDPAWELERPTGKLNVRRAMNADINEINNLFDRWTIGNDSYDLEATILIDRSGSMLRQIGSACRSAWVIKRAIEKINGRVTVMTFSDESRVLMDSSELAKPNILPAVEANGGTEPYYALLESERIMTNSTAKTKLVFLLTDGHFDNQSNPVIENLNKLGVYTSVVFMTEERWAQEVINDPAKIKQYSHGAKDFQVITQPSDLVKVAKQIVRHNVKGTL